jgi:hypothetical protein
MVLLVLLVKVGLMETLVPMDIKVVRALLVLLALLVPLDSMD